MEKRVVDNVIRIPTSLKTTFFKYWFMFLEPFHHLTNREIDVIAAFARHRFELSKVVQDEDILDKVLMSEDVKKQIRDELDITLNHFQVILGKFKQKGVMINGKINPKLLPDVVEDADSFKLLLVFDLKK